MAHVMLTNVNGNPNVGLYGYATDEYCLIGSEVSQKLVDEIEEILKVPVHVMTIAGTPLLGVFCAGNSKMLLVPSITMEHELEDLDKLGIKYTIIETRLTALGNNILCNDNGCLVNPDFSAVAKKKIRTALDVPLKPGTIADLNTVGSCAALNTNGCAIHRDVNPEELAVVQDLLDVECEPSTINFASPLLRSGILCNSNGLIIGDHSKGPEINNVDMALGFLPK